MKFVTAIFSTLTVLGAVMAQAPDNLPACGKTCINNLLADAPAFGCAAGGDGEAACLCGNATFTYGIRDCSNEACGDGAAASSVIAYGISYCSSAGVAIPTTIATVTSGTISPSVTSTGGAGGSSGSGSAITTSSYLTTETTDGSTITTSAATTIFAGGAGAGSSTSDSSGAGASASSLSSSLSGAGSSASGSLSSALSSISSAGSSAGSSATDTSSSSGFAPQMTAAPVGFLAAAGVAAMLL